MRLALHPTNSVQFNGRQLASACMGLLIAFDTYGRAGDVSAAVTDELSTPVGEQHGAASAWTITLFLMKRGRVSKRGATDECLPIVTVNREKAWITDLLQALKRMPRSSELLLDF